MKSRCQVTLALTMNNNIEQNGRQPPSSQQSAPPTDPRPRNVSSSGQRSRVCRDYIWGICTKGRQCIFPHKRTLESMKEVLKFCNDYQNRTGCSRSDCTYLHATREEKEAFFSNGLIPRVLAERYAAMASNSVTMNSEGIPPQMMYMSQPPPPPPPPAAISVVASMPVAASMPPPPPLAPIPLLLAPPPPPPPPAPPATPAPPSTPTITTTVGMANSTYTAPPSNKLPVIFPLNQPPPPLPTLPVIFDASKPPPPVVQQANGAVKRPAEPCEAGPSKVRKTDNSNVIDRLCDNCAQQELRVELFTQETQKFQKEVESKTRLFEKKSDEYDRAKLLLKTIVSPELFHKLEEYIEGIQLPQVSDILSHLSQAPTFSGGSQTQKPLIIQFLECMAGNANSRVDTASSSTLNLDMFLQSLSALARIKPSSTGSVNDSPADLLQVALDLLRNANTATEKSKTVESEPKPGPSGVNKPKNGLSRINGPRRDSSPAANSNRHPSVSIPPPPFPSAAAGVLAPGPSVAVTGSVTCPSTGTSGAMTYSSGGAAGPAPGPSVTASGPALLPSGAAVVVATYSSTIANGSALSPIGNAVEAAVYSSMVASVPTPCPSARAVSSAPCPSGSARGRAQIPASPAAYIPYQPAVPPPTTRPYYAYPSTSTNVPNANPPYHPTIPVGVAPRTAVRPPASPSVSPLNGHNYNPYAMSRFPTPPHYFPPYQ